MITIDIQNIIGIFLFMSILVSLPSAVLAYQIKESKVVFVKEFIFNSSLILNGAIIGEILRNYFKS